MTRDKQNRILQDWLLQERIICQGFREENAKQKQLIHAYRRDIRQLERCVVRLQTRQYAVRADEQRIREEIFEELCDILENEDVNVIANARELHHQQQNRRGKRHRGPK